MKKKKRKKPVREVFSAFADVTSLQGIPFIKKANRWWSTTFWCLIFLGATFMGVYQTFFVITNYLSHPYSTLVDLGFGQLEFPSVTVCNKNPVILAEAKAQAPILYDYLDSLRPDNPYATSSNEEMTTKKPSMMNTISAAIDSSSANGPIRTRQKVMYPQRFFVTSHVQN